MHLATYCQKNVSKPTREPSQAFLWVFILGLKVSKFCKNWVFKL